MANLPADSMIPEVTLNDEQLKRAHDLKRRWESSNERYLVPITLVRYIVHLEDRVAAETSADPGKLPCLHPGCTRPIWTRDHYHATGEGWKPACIRESSEKTNGDVP